MTPKPPAPNRRAFLAAAPRWSRALALAPVLVVACSREEPAPNGHAGSETCRTCHAAQYQQWAASHHGLAMQPATDDTVLGDFGDRRLPFRGQSNRFFRKGSQYWVTLEGPDGTLQDHEVLYTFGVDPLQQYLVRFPDGRHQFIPFAWDARPREQGGQRWFDLYPEFTDATGEVYWTNAGHNWNPMSQPAPADRGRTRGSAKVPRSPPGEPDRAAAVRSGDRAAATANFRKAVELEPDNAHYHYVLGLALEPTDVKAALDELDKAYRLRRQTEYLHAMCEVALRNGHSRARACLSELKPLVPDDVYRRLVQSYPR